MNLLSVAIITYNEEQNIARCLKSVEKIADEIVVIDSLSTDRTRDICQSFNVNFIEQKFLGHIEQKNLALNHTKHHYVLSLDADEAISEELQESILLAKENFTANAYCFHRLTHYVDQWIKNCGWYPDTKLRIIKKGEGQWSGTNPHDIIEMNNEIQPVFLKGNLLHYSYNSISDHVSQTNKFTTIAALAAFKNGVRSSNFKIVSRPILKFFKDYFLKKGFLDGRYGFIICFINSLSALLKYSKILDLQRGKNIEE